MSSALVLRAVLDSLRGSSMATPVLTHFRGHEAPSLSCIGVAMHSFASSPHLILSTEGIALWLEAKAKEDIIALSEARLSDALHFEPTDSCIYLSTVDRAREVFANDLGKRLFSPLVTEHGSAQARRC